MNSALQCCVQGHSFPAPQKRKEKLTLGEQKLKADGMGGGSTLKEVCWQAQWRTGLCCRSQPGRALLEAACRVAAGAGGKAGSGLMVSFGAENGTGARTRVGFSSGAGTALRQGAQAVVGVCIRVTVGVVHRAGRDGLTAYGEHQG